MDFVLDDIAAAALWHLMSSPIEHIGVLYEQSPGEIVPSETLTSNDSSSVKGSLRVPGKVRALFHNHPSGGKRDRHEDQFSEEDRIRARRLEVPSYIITSKGVVRVYDPKKGESKDVLAQLPGLLALTPHRPIPVSDEFSGLLAP